MKPHRKRRIEALEYRVQVVDLKSHRKRRVQQLEMVQPVDGQRIIIRSMILGPPEWSDAEGWRLFFMEGGTCHRWTDEEKAEALRDHLSVSLAEARRLVEEGSR